MTTKWLCALWPLVAMAGQYAGVVRDSADGHPIAGAIVTVGNAVTQSGPDGRFQIEGKTSDSVQVRAPGYKRLSAPSPAPTISLERFTPRALYLTAYGVGSTLLRGAALQLIETTELNALVIDLKGDAGLVPFPSRVALAGEIGARKITSIRDLPDFAASMHARGIYLIARIVVFKDNPLALARPDLAVKTASGAIWKDKEGLAWTDPFKQEVRDYNLGLAEEAAAAGFDEIQFDYVRFPDATEVRFSEESTAESRERAISALLDQARQRLARFNVFLAADVFGYTTWNLTDTGIGQKLEKYAPKLDYICPMLYPSGFQFGIPGIPVPVSDPFQIVYRSLQRARERTGLPAIRFRPWLQAFRDYAFDHRVFGAAQIGAQIHAADEFGSDGWMLWNAGNHYSAAGLRVKK